MERAMQMCQGCTDEEHWRCGLQTWCECECDGSPDWALFDPDDDYMNSEGGVRADAKDDLEAR